MGFYGLIMASNLYKVSYGTKDGMELVMGVKSPVNANGAAVVMVVSGGFKSSWEQAVNMSRLSQPLTDRGYTLFFVVHGSAPRYAALDAMADVRRAIRYIRHNASEYGIDANRIGITGGSSGGHTSLCIATCGDDGHPDSDDPVERESSKVQAVACFFPLADLVNWDFSHDEFGLGTKQRANEAPFAHTRKDSVSSTYKLISDTTEIRKIAYELSPFYSITSETPPVFIAHGDADRAIPLDQSIRFVNRLKENQVPTELVVKYGGGHGKWSDMQSYYGKIADWYDKYLK